MAEEQALDRVHRMGQTRPVTITRYLVKDSIEEVKNIGLAAGSRNIVDVFPSM